jgi:t-SNARE complex subunit (syntaxin)
MRFAGGYRLFTNSNASVGALLDAGANSWTTISDSAKKENFLYADGEEFLNSLSKLKLGSWNYKAQEPEQFRHYGPMAQEIFHFFGKDELGTIGNDTIIATSDIDGIVMICLQALEKRTTELKKAAGKISELEEIISSQDKKILLNQNVIEKIGNELSAARNEINKISAELKNFNFAQLED